MSKTNKKKLIRNKSIIVFTDGSCLDNGKVNAVGGIGIHFPNGELKDVSKIFKNGHCTNQRAELYAILCALRYIKQNIGLKNLHVCVKTDSKYSIDCITKWVNGWIKNGWKTKNNTPVLNKELIEIIHKYHKCFNIDLVHVNAHSNKKTFDAVANDRADKLAVMASNKAFKEQISDQYTTDIDDTRYRNKQKPRSNYNSKTNKLKPRANTNNKTNGVTRKGRNQGFHINGFPKGIDFTVELIKSK